MKKGTLLVSAGDRTELAYYVVKGCLRSYVLDQKGKEHIFQFAPEDWIISDLEMIKNGGGAFLYIDAIEDSEIKEVPMAMMQGRIYSKPELIEGVLKKFQNRVYSLQKRVIQLMSYTAEERYTEFLKTYPNLASRIPLKMIASYLGVTPESLSRVRRDLVKK